MKYSFITQHKNTYPISVQCRVLGVNRSGYYHYRANVANKLADPVRQEMLDWVKDIAASSRYSYGSRRMAKALNVLGYPVNRAGKGDGGINFYSLRHLYLYPPNNRLPDRKRCWLICPAIPIALPSPTIDSLPMMNVVLRSNGKTTAPNTVCVTNP
ncbi:MAG: hypothetical protein ACI9BW_002404 [Gammaproteobacteria bacterium]|jgi:hypothetical protein